MELTLQKHKLAAGCLGQPRVEQLYIKIWHRMVLFELKTVIAPLLAIRLFLPALLEASTSWAFFLVYLLLFLTPLSHFFLLSDPLLIPMHLKSV